MLRVLAFTLFATSASAADIVPGTDRAAIRCADGPGSYPFTAALERLGPEQRVELDRRIEVWWRNLAHLAPADAALEIDRQVCRYFVQATRRVR